jgi:hypothetical protein
MKKRPCAGQVTHQEVFASPLQSVFTVRGFRASENVIYVDDGFRLTSSLICGKQFDREARQTPSFRAGKESADAVGVLYGVQ